MVSKAADALLVSMLVSGCLAEKSGVTPTGNAKRQPAHGDTVRTRTPHLLLPQIGLLSYTKTLYIDNILVVS
jgi:hypothetical protein